MHQGYSDEEHSHHLFSQNTLVGKADNNKHTDLYLKTVINTERKQCAMRRKMGEI